MAEPIIVAIHTASTLYGVASKILAFYDDTIDTVLVDVAEANLAAARRNWENVRLLENEGKSGRDEANRAITQLELAYELLTKAESRFNAGTKRLRVSYKRYTIISTIIGYYANQRKTNLIEANYLSELKDSFSSFARDARWLEGSGMGLDIKGAARCRASADDALASREYILSYIFKNELGIDWGSWMLVDQDYSWSLQLYQEDGKVLGDCTSDNHLTRTIYALFPKFAFSVSTPSSGKAKMLPL